MLKIGIMGTGHMAQKMAVTVQKMRLSGYREVILSAVSSREKEKAEKFAARFEIPNAYGSYERMLSGSETELAYVATPLACHDFHVRMCLENGKHVLCEKPMAVSQAQAERMFALAEERRLFAAEAMWTRYMPMRRIIRDAVWSGKAGEPVSLSASLCYSVSHKKRLMDMSLAGGALMEVGVYPLHFSDMVFGQPKVRAVVPQQEGGGPDLLEAFILQHEGGQLSVLSSGIACTQGRTGTVGCRAGYYLADNINNPMKLEVYDSSHRCREVLKAPPQITGLEYEVMEAADAINRQKTEPASMSHADTLRMLGVLDIIRQKMNLKYPCEEQGEQ